MSTATVNLIDDLRPETRLTAAAAAGRPIITTHHEQFLRAELDRLRHRRDVEFVERLRDARAFGSAGANDDYLQIKEEEAVLAASIAQISTLLEKALVVDPAEFEEAGVIAVGSLVEVADQSNGQRQELRLIGGHQPAAPGLASAGSPIGQALLGRRIGDTVEVSLPGGRRRKLEVIAVETGSDRVTDVVGVKHEPGLDSR
jgi:transcription elongation factor GreA